jgi:hypothetical protein
MVGTTAKAVLYTWLYNNTRGSLLLTILFHGSGNAGGVFLPVANTVTDDNISLLIIQTLIEITAAVVVTIAAGSARLSRTASKQEQPSAPLDQISESVLARV